MRVFRRLLSSACAAAFVALTACAAPTLPLPPPSIPTVSAQSDGVVHLTSDRGVEPNALVVIYNRNPAVPLNRRVGGAQADASGSWDADVFAKSGDVLDITQEFGTTRSAAVSLTVP